MAEFKQLDEAGFRRAAKRGKQATARHALSLRASTAAPIRSS
jgi:hypothetical protein